MKNRNIILHETPLGTVKIQTNESGVEAIQFLKNTENIPPPSIAPSEMGLEVVRQLDEYFDRKRVDFDLLLAPVGTDFQHRVWAELVKIPFGTTISYKTLANRLGDEKVIRAAAAANGKNPIWLVVPCHRVIGSSGDLVGYAGGLDRKKWLLEHENAIPTPNTDQLSLF